MSRQRPVLSIPRSSQLVVLDIVAVVGLVAVLVIAIYARSILPEIIPVHFGIDGRPNSWGSKAILWIFPPLALLNFIVLTIISRYPHTFNYAVRITEANALKQYQIAVSMLNWLKAEFVWLLAYIEWQILGAATIPNTGLDIWFLPAVIIAILSTVRYWMRQSYLAR